jgi:hypothetical protein
MKSPQDAIPYPRDPRSRPLGPGLADGGYAYVQDAGGTVYGVPDESHIHPKILGGGQAALYAGDLTIRGGEVFDLTNLSGTFQFDYEAGLREVAAQLSRQGVVVQPNAVRFFPPDGSLPVILQ